MDEFTRKHLNNWLEHEFRDDDERAQTDKILTDLWESDVEYWESHAHSWWTMLDIGKRSREARTARAMRGICKS